MLSLTENAQKAVSRFIKGSDTPVVGLRVSISDGGCSGYQYGMSLVESSNDEDTVIALGDIKVIVDPATVPLVKDMVIDFQDSMQGSGFKFENPNATKSCGCGKSFSA